MIKNYKLYDVIRSLSEKEVRQMRKLLKSPFFTTRNDVNRLFGILVKIGNSGKAFPSKEKIFKKIYPTEEWNDLKLRGTMSDLLELIEECWVINSHRENKIEEKLLLSEIYRKKNLNKLHVSAIKKTQKLLDEFPKRNADYYQMALGLEMEQMKFRSSTKRTDHLFLQEISDTNDKVYLIQKLQNACAQLSHQLVYKTTYDFGLLNELLDTIEKKEYIQTPAIAIYYYCFRFLTEAENLDYFKKFKEQLKLYRNHFTNEELGAPYRLALNLCIRKTNEGVSSFIQDSWDLYKEGIETGILLVNDNIPRFTFNNAIAAALKLNKFEWIAGFVKDNSHQLEEQFKDQTINFNLARLEYSQKNYGQALVHLQSSEYKDLVNNLISKMLLVKIYFELEEYESLESHLDSFQQFIRRREVSDYHRTNFLNVISIVRKIISLPEYAKQERQKLKVRIAEEAILSERDWLLEKV